MDYSYTVKVLNGKRKKPVSKQIRHLNSNFSSIVEMRRRISQKRKKDVCSYSGTRRQEKEDRVKSELEELRELHEEKCSQQQLKLWARMISMKVVIPPLMYPLSQDQLSSLLERNHYHKPLLIQQTLLQRSSAILLQQYQKLKVV